MCHLLLSAFVQTMLVVSSRQTSRVDVTLQSDLKYLADEAGTDIESLKLKVLWKLSQRLVFVTVRIEKCKYRCKVCAIFFILRLLQKKGFIIVLIYFKPFFNAVRFAL